MATVKERPKPFLIPQFCKACGRCIEACPKDCIEMGKDILPETGLPAAVFNLETCSACGMCISACPEPYGLQARLAEGDFELTDPAAMFGPKHTTAPTPKTIPDEVVSLPSLKKMILKGTYASAVGAILAGCRHFFGYPITPSTEGAELMAKLLPHLDGVFLQAVSEVATINHMYGCSGAGLRCMTFTSSPGFSLMLEGLSYMIGSELPGVVVNVMRGGPGLGNIGPEQGDIKLACRGLGHGNTHALVFSPASPQEMLDVTMLAFDLSFQYRHPAIILADGYLGQMTGVVKLPTKMIKPGIPDWAVYGDAMHRGNLINSIILNEQDLEKHNLHIIHKYEKMKAAEQRADLFCCQDAQILLVSCNTPARMAKGAVENLRSQNIAAGLFRPITLWPFPINQLQPVLPHVKKIVVVEASFGQLEAELRLAMSEAGLGPIPIEHLQHYGGVLPDQQEIVDKVMAIA